MRGGRDMRREGREEMGLVGEMGGWEERLKRSE